MPFSPGYDTGVLQLIFQQISTLTTNIAVNSTVPNTVLWASLHTAAPSSNSQSASEAAYTSYTRTSIARTTVGWVVTGGSSAGAASSVSPLATIAFPAATGGTETETYFGLGLSSAGAGSLILSGSISPTLAVSNGVTPQLTTGSSITIT